MSISNQQPLSTHLYIWAAPTGGLTAFFRREDVDEVPPPPVLLEMDREKLANRIDRTQEHLDKIAKKAVWTVLSNPLSGPLNEEQEEDFLECLEWVITAGSSLYYDLAKDPDFGEILKEIDRLPNDSRLTVITNCAVLPWEILYPESYNRKLKGKNDESNVFDPGRLWGNRFSIEIIFSEKGKRRRLPTAKHESSKPFISLNLNPRIGADLGDDSPYRPVESHERFYNIHLDGHKLGDYKTDADEIVSTLVSNKCDATIIYLCCHGRSEKPFRSGQTEALQLDKEVFIAPHDIRQGTFLSGPIIILNSCCSGAVSPLSFSSFLSTFQDKEALGLLATTFPVPTAFASAFGQRFLRYYLRGFPVGVVLLRMRRKLLRRNNPLGMFYSLQCPMHVRASRLR